MNRIINANDNEQLYTLASKIVYKVLDKCYAVSGLQKLRGMQNDIYRQEGDGFALVHDAIVFLLEYAESGLINLDRIVEVETRKYNNEKRAYEKKEVLLIQAVWKYIRSRISLNGAPADKVAIAYIEDFEDNTLFVLCGMETKYQNSNNDNSDIISFIEKRKNFISALSPTQEKALECLELRMTQADTAVKLNISVNSVISARREIRKKARNFFDCSNIE